VAHGILTGGKGSGGDAIDYGSLVVGGGGVDEVLELRLLPLALLM
jgi:hypothetical protein